MKVRFSLHLQTLAMLLAYLFALSLAVFIGFNTQFGIGWEALYKSPLGDRVDNIADAISSRLRSSTSKEWNSILSHFGEKYHAQFYLFADNGLQFAGKDIALPEPVAARLQDFPHGPHTQHGPFLPPSNGFFEHFLLPAPLTASHVFIATVPPDMMLSRLSVKAQNSALEPGPPPMPGTGPKIEGPAQAIRQGRPWIGGPGPGMAGPPPSEMMAPVVALSSHPLPPFLTHPHGRFMVHTDNPGRFWLCTRVGPINNDSFMMPMPCVLIASFDNIWQSTLLVDMRFIALWMGIILALTFLFWLPFIQHITNALSRLTSATESIADGRFDTRLPVKSSDEIGRLSQAVNVMAERLEGYVLGQRRFLGDISHELSTPIARLQMAVELLKDCQPSEQERLLSDINEEMDEMSQLVNELLAYSKAGLQGKQSKDPVDVPLLPLLQGLQQKLTAPNGLNLHIANGLTVKADPLLLERAISNVLRNSIRYAGQAGPIDATAHADGPWVSLTIKDCGPGVKDDMLKVLAEPFFRPEPSRNRDSGGVGLGLAIVKSCIEACEGSFTVRNGQERGLEVVLKLKGSPHQANDSRPST